MTRGLKGPGNLVIEEEIIHDLGILNFRLSDNGMIIISKYWMQKRHKIYFVQGSSKETGEIREKLKSTFLVNIKENFLTIKERRQN